jgi:AmmeMemoRadiSam system protein A
MTAPDLGHALLRIARSAIAESLGLYKPEEADHAALKRQSATFVTLKRSGELRGCIGSLRAVRALGEDVRLNAIAAAFHDPRFPPLAAAEFEDTSVEVSLLSISEPLEAATENDLLARLRPGVDGLILEFGHHRATLLPQVWDKLAEPCELLAALKRKAGLPAGFWSPRVKVSRFEATRWIEHDSVSSGVKQ